VHPQPPASPQALDELLRFAIEHKRLIGLRYKGCDRIAEPHDYGIQGGVTRLFVYQLAASVRRPGKDVVGWRCLDVEKIEACVILDETFPGSRGRDYPRHMNWDVVYARVK